MVAHKCAQHNDELGRIAIASRNISKCQAIIDSVNAKGSLKQPAEIKAYALNALDIEVRKAFNSIPIEQRKVVTSHDAFGYFGRAYGIARRGPKNGKRGSG